MLLIWAASVVCFCEVLMWCASVKCSCGVLLWSASVGAQLLRDGTFSQLKNQAYANINRQGLLEISFWVRQDIRLALSAAG